LLKGNGYRLLIRKKAFRYVMTDRMENPSQINIKFHVAKRFFANQKAIPISFQQIKQLPIGMPFYPVYDEKAFRYVMTDRMENPSQINIKFPFNAKQHSPGQRKGWLIIAHFAFTDLNGMTSRL
jgi:hypothetical protein